MYSTDGLSEKDCQSIKIIKLAVKFDEEKLTLIDARAGSVKTFYGRKYTHNSATYRV
jgi:hypothetical protein